MADINRDGKPDIITADRAFGGPGTVAILLNQTVPGSTTASFAGEQTFVTGDGSTFVAAGDLNGDGRPDLVTSYDGLENYQVGVLLNTTTPGSNTVSFANPVTLNTAVYGPAAPTIGDLNGDGRPDLIVPDFHAGAVSVFINETIPGSVIPTFTAAQTFNVGAGPNDVALATSTATAEWIWRSVTNSARACPCC